MMSLRQAKDRPAPIPDSAKEGVSERAPIDPHADFTSARAAIDGLDIQLSTIFDAIVDGLVVFDEEGPIRGFNSGAERMFGYAAEEVLGHDIGLLAARPNKVRADWTLADYIGTGRELLARRKDGALFPVDIALSEMSIGGRRHFLGTVRDITGRKQAEKAREERFIAELTRSNAELARFAYIASHDLQEPLRMIASYLDLLSATYGDKLDSDAQEYIAFAVDGAARMKRLINDLLDYSRVGGDTLKIEPVDSGALVADVVASLGMIAQETGARIEAGKLPWVMADGGQLRRVFQNLIGNALKYHSDAPPVVTVEATRDANGWQFSVADNGIGIDPRFKTKIFEVFTRLHNRSKYPGSGIGLAVARLVVERHGGSIWVDPAEGGGSRFSFTLPESEM